MILNFVALIWFSALSEIAVRNTVVGALRMMAKADPMMRQLYLRHIAYRPTYRSPSSPWRRH